MVDPVVEAVLVAVPAFAERFLALLDAADGDPGAAAVLTELADYVAELTAGPAAHRAELARCLGAVETVAGGGVDAEAVVSWAFLDSLPVDDRRRLRPWLGPSTSALLDELEFG